MPVRRLTEQRDTGHYMPWLRERIETPPRPRHREAGVLWGDPKGDGWDGVLKITNDLVFNIKGEWSVEHEEHLEVEVQHPDWIVLDQSPILLPSSGGMTFRGFIYYPGFVRDQMQGLAGEYFSFNWQLNNKTRLLNKRERAFRITCGGTQSRRGRPPEW